MSRVLILIILSSFSSSTLAGIVATDKEDAKIVKNLKEQGFNLDTSSKLVLNDLMKKKKVEDGSWYQVGFACEHKKSALKDECHISSVKIRKSK
jgi:hypothetical protein